MQCTWRKWSTSFSWASHESFQWINNWLLAYNSTKSQLLPFDAGGPIVSFFRAALQKYWLHPPDISAIICWEKMLFKRTLSHLWLLAFSHTLRWSTITPEWTEINFMQMLTSQIKYCTGVGGKRGSWEKEKIVALTSDILSPSLELVNDTLSYCNFYRDKYILF